MDRKLRVLLAIVLLIMVVGCSRNNNKSTNDIITDVNAMNKISINEFLNDIESMNDGIYLMSSTVCPSCNIAFDIINSAAAITNNNINYINLVWDDGRISQDDANTIIRVLNNILKSDPETGEKTIYTPHLFIIKDHSIEKSFIGLGDDFQNTDDGLKTLHEKYIKFLEEK